jgi:sigma-E factor negative regulatory protein RseB
MMRFLCCLAFVFAGCGSALAQAPNDPLSWLGRISNAAHKLNYTGTFTYQSGKHVETSRITHLVDTSGEYEKLEALDGSPGRWSATTMKCSASSRSRSS